MSQSPAWFIEQDPVSNQQQQKLGQINMKIQSEMTGERENSSGDMSSGYLYQCVKAFAVHA